jgi:predicted TPR repeat methyltransferase
MAWDREVYDDLYVAEAVRFLEEEEEGEPWELITATDVMPYIGELGPILRAAAAHIAPGGHLAFSTETLPEADFAGRPWTVGPHQRFAHREDHVRDLLEACGFSVIAAEPITVRHERGEPIRGHLVLARKR